MAIKRLLFALFVSLVVSACGGGSGTNAGASKFNPLVPVASTPAPLFTSAPSTILMSKGAVETFVIGGGAKPYLVSSSDAGQVTSAVVDAELKLTAVEVGSSTILITDSLGNKLQLSVSVGSQIPLSISAPSSVTLLPGDINAQTYLISGGVGPYSVTSGNPSVVNVSQPSGGALKVVGVVNGGPATVTVRDSANPQGEKTFAVNVSASASAPLSVSPLSVAGTVGETVKFKIQGGSGSGYSVVSVNESIALPR